MIINNDHNATCYFGTGDIKISAGTGKIYENDRLVNGICVLENQDPPQPIGEKFVNNDPIVYDTVPVIMFFSKPESIDALIQELESCKRFMLEENSVIDNDVSE